MRSIRWRLTFAYAIALLATMVAFGAILYYARQQTGVRSLDQRLLLEAELSVRYLERSHGVLGQLVQPGDPPTLDPAIAAEMVKGRPESTAAGQFSPFASIAREGDGYAVSGRFQFGSGIGHASWVGGAGFVRGADGNPEIRPSGLPAYLCFFVPRAGVELRDGWSLGRVSAAAKDGPILKAAANPRHMQGYAIGR